ncbi:MAG: ATP-binding cassette domain-containing protein [Candidatus Aminicenantia bacterium]
MNAIKVESLVKMYDSFTAVDSISFNVSYGELFGLLGPNGAGKTTSISILCTLLNPTSGYAEVAGFDVRKKRDEVRKSIGVVFQDPTLDTKLTGKENLQFHAIMYGIQRAEAEKRIKEVLELVELENKADVLVEKYSGGMKRRLEIARGLIHKPKILFLDEPTLGLDAQTRRRIWDYIRRFNKEEGVTIILTTHYMEEADYLCDRVAIMDRGKIVAMDSPVNLKNMLGGDIVSIEVEGNTESYIEKLREIKWIKTFGVQNGILTMGVEMGERKIPSLINIAEKSGVKVNSVNLHKPSLEDVFLFFTGRKIRDEDYEQSEKRTWTIRTMRR